MEDGFEDCLQKAVRPRLETLRGEMRQGTEIVLAWKREKKEKYNRSESYIMSNKLEMEQLFSIFSEERTEIYATT